MSVTVRIPPMMREATGGQRAVESEGATVGAILEHLERQHPGFRDRVLDDGELRRFVNIYVNEDDIRYLDQLATPVADGDTVSILPAVAGG